MKWILYIMLFSSPAANVSGDDKTCLEKHEMKEIRNILLCRPNYEKKKLWSLQSNSQTGFSQFESCVRMQDKLIVSSNVASTMAMRSWCICETEGEGKCPTDADAYNRAFEIRSCEIEGKADCDVSAKIAKDAEAQGQSSNSLQLYPLSKEEKKVIFEREPQLKRFERR